MSSCLQQDVMLGVAQTSWDDWTWKSYIPGVEQGQAPGPLMTWLSHGTSRGLFTPNFFLAGYKDLLAWAAFNKISFCGPNHSKQLPSRRWDIEAERRGVGGSEPCRKQDGAGEREGRQGQQRRGQHVWGTQGSPPTQELDKGTSLQLAGNLNTWFSFSGSKLRTV